MTVRSTILRAGRALPPLERLLVLVSVRVWVNTAVIVQLEWLKNSNDLIGNRTRDLVLEIKATNINNLLSAVFKHFPSM
jgi:hypothetical protein